MSKQETITEVKAQLDELQLWFARKPYGFREKCSDEQLKQFEDREKEQDRLIDVLESLQSN